MENKGSRGDGFRGVPDVGVVEGVGRSPELLDAEVVVVDKALEGFFAILHCSHFDTSAHAVEGHRDHGVALRPTDGSVFGIVDDRPDTGLGLDERLVAVGVVLRHETVNFRVLVEIIGGVGLALGDGAVSDVVVGIRDFVGGAAAEKVVGVDVSGIGGVRDGGKEITMGFVTPRDHIFVGISEGRFEVRSWQIRPLETIGFRNTPRGGVISNGLFTVAIHGIAHVPTEGIPMAGEGLGIEARDLLGKKLAKAS